MNVLESSLFLIISTEKRWNFEIMFPRKLSLPHIIEFLYTNVHKSNVNRIFGFLRNNVVRCPLGVRKKSLADLVSDKFWNSAFVAFNNKIEMLIAQKL